MRIFTEDNYLQIGSCAYQPQLFQPMAIQSEEKSWIIHGIERRSRMIVPIYLPLIVRGLVPEPPHSRMKNSMDIEEHEAHTEYNLILELGWFKPLLPA